MVNSRRSSVNGILPIILQYYYLSIIKVSRWGIVGVFARNLWKNSGKQSLEKTVSNLRMNSVENPCGNSWNIS